ncbi:MAG: carbon monoxide dehydrogenase subunit G [Pricia sp.]|nr:carbon monoxide dehydrogenase subunit G [Pricia sp.]
MKINGNYTLSAPPNVFWKMVMDPEVLEKVTPGIKELKEEGQDSYEAISVVKVGPVKGNFQGKLSIKDKVTEESCTLVVDQKSKMGNVVAEIVMKLIPAQDNKTEVQYTGEAKMSGTLASMGQRIMGGVVSTLSKQFFTSMEKEIEARQN